MHILLAVFGFSKNWSAKSVRSQIAGAVDSVRADPGRKAVSALLATAGPQVAAHIEGLSVVVQPSDGTYEIQTGNRRTQRHSCKSGGGDRSQVG